MSVAAAFRVSRVPMLMLAMVGVFWGGIAGLMPDIKAGVGASDGQMGLVLLSPAAGSMLAMAAAPRLILLLGPRHGMVAGLALCSVFFLPALAGAPGGLAAALLVAGAAVAFTDISANIRISSLESRHGLHLMNVNHAMFSLAFGLTALVVGFARKADLVPAQVLPALSAVALVLVVAAWERRATVGPAGVEDAEGGRALPPWGAVFLTAGVLFAAFIGENATEAWSALHIERTLGGAPGQGSFGPAMLGFSMAVFRFSGQLVAARIGEARLILYSALAGVAGASVIAAAPTAGVVMAGAAVMGLGMAVIVPSVNTMLGRLVSEAARARALSRAWMVGMVGFFVGPAMMGALAEWSSLRLSFAAVAVIVALIVPAVLALARR